MSLVSFTATVWAETKQKIFEKFVRKYEWKRSSNKQKAAEIVIELKINVSVKILSLNSTYIQIEPSRSF